MEKAILVCMACAAALMIGNAASEEKAVTPPVAEKPDPTLTPREITEREQEYLAALKKCEPLQERARQDCIKALKARYGLM
jgi:hypothetical protein